MDRMQAPPRGAFFGLLSDLASGTVGYMQDPRRTQQLQGLGAMLESTRIPSLLEGLSYGDSMTTGSGMTMRPNEDVRGLIELATAFAPAGKPAAAAAKAGTMALGRAGERMAERVVPQVMERGGLPAEMLGAMAQGTQSRVLPPKRFQGPLLEGLPEAVDVGGGRMEKFGTDQRIVDVAQRYMADKGMTYSPQKPYAAVDVKRAEKIAKEYAAMQHDPNNPKTKKAYEALAKETQDQYEALLKAGYKFDFIRGADPYGNPRNAINDLVMNKRMSVFPTESGFGSSAADISGNPLLARSDLRIANDPSTTYNDLFRAVHDVFGHAKHGVGFRARGEENAFQSHARMYSPEALPAAASETRGQNSWVNFGPFGERNRIASPSDTIYADQKTGLMPAYTYQEGLLSDWLWPEGVYNRR
jgi:hypothetical protein